jgi:hypothetical protein
MGAYRSLEPFKAYQLNYPMLNVKTTRKEMAIFPMPALDPVAGRICDEKTSTGHLV